MILLLYFSFLFVIFLLRRSPSPALMLLAIYLASLVAGIPLNYDFQVTTAYEALNVVFVAAMLTLLIAPWNRFPYRVAIAEPNERRVRRLTTLLLCIHAVGF